MERAKEREDVSPSTDPIEVLASVLGPLLYRRWFSREALDKRFVKSVVSCGTPRE
jgi:hypothetical protein